MKQNKATNTTKAPGFDEDSIGEAAGVLWRHLLECAEGGSTREITLSSLKKIPGLKADEAIAAVGWLAREGKLHFASDKRKTVVSLALVTN